MNEVLFILMAEIIFILVLVLLTMLFVGWRRKKEHQLALEQLLERVAEQEEARKSVLIGYLTVQQKMNNQAAMELCEDFVEAEKQFMYLFLEQQMKHKSISGMYQHLCELLDKYLNLLADNSINSKADKISQ